MSTYDYRRRKSSDMHSPEIAIKSASPVLADHTYLYSEPSEQMFDFDEDPYSKPYTSFTVPQNSHDPFNDFTDYSPISTTMSAFPSPTSHAFELGTSPSNDPYFSSVYGQYPAGEGAVAAAPSSLDDSFYNWVNPDPESPSLQTSTSPITIRSTTSQPPSPFIAYREHSHLYPTGASFSPSDLAANYPLPASPSSYDDVKPHHGFHFDVPPPQTTPDRSSQSQCMQPPAWTHMWDAPTDATNNNSNTYGVATSSMRQTGFSQDYYPQSSGGASRVISFGGNIAGGKDLGSFQSSSAPSGLAMTAPSRRRDSASDDRDATVRRTRRRVMSQDEGSLAADLDMPSRSLLKPPKLAPSAWQLYFTDWISRQQAMAHTRKLNVAQAAKEAGQDYAALTDAEKEPYRKRSLLAKEARELEHQAYMHSLTPADIKKENQFRASQRKAGKSRKSNIKDPNAPKKPLSAYFMFLQRIRADPGRVSEVFGRETETTKQSVLAAAKWRSMTDDERKPFLAQAEQEKLDYEAARRMYEEGSAGNPALTNFSIMPGSPAERAFRASRVKREPSSDDSEEMASTDDDKHRYQHYLTTF